jgi:hypothetical protein
MNKCLRCDDPLCGWENDKGTLFDAFCSIECFNEYKENTMDQETIDNNFTYHKPMPTDLIKFERLRNMAKEYSELVNELCPDSREKSIAITKIEESNMWSNASIVRDSEW